MFEINNSFKNNNNNNSIDNSNNLKCKIKTALPMYLDIPRETLMCIRVSDRIENAIYRCYTTPNDISTLVTSLLNNNNNNSNNNSNSTIDSRSHFIVLHINNNNQTTTTTTVLCEFIVEPKFIERDIRTTTTYSSPIKSTSAQAQQTQQQPTIQLWFLKEHMDLLHLENDQITYVNIIPKYSLIPIDNIYLSYNYSSNSNKQQQQQQQHQQDTIIELNKLFSLEWARSGLKSGTPLSYSGGTINLFQRSGDIINYKYNLNKPIITECAQQTQQHDNIIIINQFGLINNQTKIIFNNNSSNNNNNNTNTNNNNEELKSYDNNSRIKIEKLFKIYFGGNLDSKKYNELGISKAKSLLFYGPSSCGKSTIINLISNRLNLKIVHVNLSDLVKYQPNTKGLLLKYYQAKQNNNSNNTILLFDQIDEIFPQYNEAGTNSNSNNVDQQNMNSLYTLFLKLLNNNSNQDNNEDEGNNNNIFIIGITNKIKNLNSFIRSNFEEEIRIDPPNLEKRLEIFNWNLKDIGNHQDCLESNRKVIEKINESCNGLMGGDISILCRNAKIKSIKRYKEEEEEEEEEGEEINLNKIKFLEIDFIDEFGGQYRKDKTMISKISPSIPKVKWSDIGGLEEAKNVLKEMVVWDYQYSDSIKRLGVKTPKGILMYGPPGTGKTMLAKCVAYEANANFIPINISELIQGEIGESEKMLSEIFRIAIHSSPSIIFIDEIQSIFGLKESSSGGNKKLISQLLIELDNAIGGNSSTNSSGNGRVMILAATNMPQAIDPSFLRVGRFEKSVYIGPPQAQERKSIFETLIKSNNIKIDSTTVDLDKLAANTANYTGSDINALLKKSGLYAIQRDINTTSITMDDIMSVYWEMKPSVSTNQILQLREWEKSRKLI